MKLEIEIPPYCTKCALCETPEEMTDTWFESQTLEDGISLYCKKANKIIDIPTLTNIT